MNDREILELIDPQFHGEFLHFLETGQMDDIFWLYLNHDRSAQAAVEAVFRDEAVKLVLLSDSRMRKAG